MLDLIGDVEGKTALIVDDFTISAGSLADAARISADRGAAQIYAMVSHGLITEAAVERLADSPIERLFITDTVETQPVELPPTSRSSPSPPCSARPSAASTAARASASSSNERSCVS